ncbi:alkene reductase [Paramagnetospirillum magneticum]|uniref:NADH:flavin oxidoreductase n=1 Tax=Paramagnetospirillum magneticum (strain ATCC 700264 / AMB-1) TaxID=342108 RepID=Q2W2E8_PARM1|nr:alkene reductase [Paramagnetospirillum magneticum]BAE51977.1 NADH:flavin oxidoreductase [Paramagnetospirillum magneticum AMB-1]
MTKDLFQPLRLGELTLPSRIAMAPMTRSRADDEGVQPEIAATYYGQRAGAGLIISEGIYPSAMGKGYVRTPGLHTDAQVAAWSRVTKAVHDKGGRIFAQLMHTGRVAVPAFLPGGALPVAPSAIRAEGQAYTDQGMVPMVTPRALETSEIAGVIAEYRDATRRALEAGFDGVELHAASGYLPEQFLSSKSNQRTDGYGGSIANRVRFVVEVLEAMASVAGSCRVGIKISPEMNFNDVADDTPQETYRHLVERIAPMNIAYLHVALFGTPTDYHGLLRPLFKGAYLAGGGFTGDTAEAALAQGRADAIVFGAAFIANPDLPKRLAEGLPLAEPDKVTFYAPGPRGYIDYPPVV